MSHDKSAAASAWNKATERRIIARARKGDRQALRELIDQHKDRLHAFILRTTRNHHDAEEICQDAFLKALQALHTFDDTFRFSTWLFTIGYRLCLNSMRKRSRRPLGLDAVGAIAEGEGSDTGAAQSEEARRLKEVVWGAVDQLSPQQRAALILFYQHDQGCDEISHVLQVPVATVKSHLHRGRAKLREMLAPALAEDDSRLRLLRELAG